jgi:hypothetical protein
VSTAGTAAAPALARGGVRERSLLPAALAAVLTTALLALLFAPREVWVVQHHGAPPAVAWLPLALYLGIAWRTRAWRGSFARRALLAAALLALYGTLRVGHFGDHDGHVHHAGTPILDVAEPLASWLYHAVRAALGVTAMQYVAPLTGAASALVWLAVGDALLRAEDDRGYARKSALVALCYLASGVHLVFSVNFIEKTLLGIPFIGLYVLGLLRYGDRVQASAPAVPALLAAAAALGVACLMHGQSAFLIPTLVIAIACLRGRSGWRAALRDVCAAGFLMLAMAVACLTALWLAGFALIPGHSVGGSDASRLVPLQPIDGPTFRFVMFSMAHLVDVANILLLAAPLALAGPLHLLRPAAASVARDRRLLALVSLGGVSFIACWNYDLGFPLDWDLMLTLAVPLQLTLLGSLVANGTRGLGALWAVAGIGAVLSWAVIGSFTTSQFDPHGQGNSDAARLEVDGVGAGTEGGPFTVTVPVTAPTVSLAVHGPAGARFVVYSGSRNPAGFGRATIGTLEIGTPPDLRDLGVVFAGTLDAAGSAAREVTFEATGPGPLANLQAVVHQPEGSARPYAMSATFYVEAW